MVVQGRGPITRDGCAVEVYRRLPVGNEPLIVHAVAGLRGSVLDLGAGVGRIADPLAQLGHRVVAVDDSAEMLGHVRSAMPVLSAIETLRLDERFEVVLLASHLVNTPDAVVRAGLLASVAFHLADRGRALIQWHPPEWFDSLEAGKLYRGVLGELRSELEVREQRGNRIAATVRYQSDEDTWSQSFVAQRLTKADIVEALRQAGLELVDDPLDEPGWLVAQRADDAVRR